ncbi:hypothetical protein HJFPF1_01891 [Paramyrothecium foliicola]|nr:hypothetical protein HJFPF1_01891 [Paramyrothecium foliicola]
MPSAHITSPLAMQASQQNIRLVASPQELYTSLNATLASKYNNRPSTPIRHIQEDDYTVPAPPPPSPVSFRSDIWPTTARR